jgi:hypothetical protein
MTRALNMMLDSGAFSCWRQGKSIDIDLYADFCLSRKGMFHVAVNLDVLPGTPKRKAAPAELEACARQGFENWIHLRKRGVDTLPVFHQGEPHWWIDEYVKNGATYLGISPRNRNGVAAKLVWLRQVFGYLSANGGFPSIRTHGFGLTAAAPLLEFPWTTADSVSWMMGASMGHVTLPLLIKGEAPDYRRSMALTFSERDTSVGVRHWKSLSEQEQAEVRGYLRRLEDEYDVNLSAKELRSDYAARDVVSIAYYLGVQELHRAVKVRPSPGFHAAKSSYGQATPLKDPFQLFFSMTISDAHAWALDKCRVKNRLFSYWLLESQKNPMDIATYIKTGRYDDFKKRTSR